ncbi:hypothetical protein TIFTF001_037656 [Ficus carica]|uniref:Uncharacterized protein n=1 Tax=Ficus carica TaxID=3494 RepID=A0AA88JDU0_FICCA|nr:hypothetical protein TIFTF001_037656 [Ficus carica]
MKNQPMPEAIHALIIENSASTLSDEKTNCHGNANAHDHHVNSFIKDFEPIPNLSAYPDDKITDAKIQFTRSTGDVSTKENMSFAKDFEPTPNLSAYNY